MRPLYAFLIGLVVGVLVACAVFLFLPDQILRGMPPKNSNTQTSSETEYQPAIPAYEKAEEFRWVSLSDLATATSSTRYVVDNGVVLAEGNLAISVTGYQSSIEITGADISTFVAAVDGNGYVTLYSKDKNHVYYSGKIVAADPATFDIVAIQHDPTGAIDAIWSKDKDHVYFSYGNHEIIPGADPETFSPAMSTTGFLVGFIDKNHIYDTNNQIIR